MKTSTTKLFESMGFTTSQIKRINNMLNYRNFLFSDVIASYIDTRYDELVIFFDENKYYGECIAFQMKYITR